MDLNPLLLTSPLLRFTLYEFFGAILPEVVVLSYNDISPRVKFKTVDRISIAQESLPESEPNGLDSSMSAEPTVLQSEAPIRN